MHENRVPANAKASVYDENILKPRTTIIADEERLEKERRLLRGPSGCLVHLSLLPSWLSGQARLATPGAAHREMMEMQGIVVSCERGKIARS